MDEQWMQTYRTEIAAFAEKIASFDKGDIERKDYKGVSGGMGSQYCLRPALRF